MYVCMYDVCPKISRQNQSGEKYYVQWCARQNKTKLPKGAKEKNSRLSK